MTHIEQAIREAVENGWDENRAIVKSVDFRDGHEGMGTSMKSTDRAFLDPLFWQALGKARAWKQDDDITQYVKDNGTYVKGHPILRQNGEKISRLGEWIHHWHRFIDHLAEGKDAESFFKDL